LPVCCRQRSARASLRVGAPRLQAIQSALRKRELECCAGALIHGGPQSFFQGEYLYFDIDRAAGLPSLQFAGWYAQASWTLTGEMRAYNPSTGSYGTIIPVHPFTAAGGWGAWEVAGRYSVTDLNDRLGFKTGIAGGDQVVYTLGLNWYVNRNVRFMFDYLHGTIDKQLSSVLAMPAGAKFDAAAMRAQVSF
jgi:phosphate-selective porin OprO/OprP